MKGEYTMARLPGPKNYLTEQERNNKPKITKKLILRIFSYLKPYWFQLLLVFIIIVISAICGLLPSIITGKIIDVAILGKNFSLLVKLSILAIAALTFSQVIAVLESYINSWISAKIVFDMKNEMFAHLQTMPVSFFNSEKQGEIITRMNSDISGVSTVISQTLTSFISNICTVVTTIFALFSIDWQLAIVGIVVIPLLVLPTKTAGKNRWKYLSQS